MTTAGASRDETSDVASPDPEILAGNLAALARFPDVLDAIESIAPYPSDWIVIAKSGEPTLIVHDVAEPDAAMQSGEAQPATDPPATRLRVMHSRHQPRREAERQLPDEHDVVGSAVFLGAGLGYLPLVYAARATPENSIVWVETDRRLFRTAIEWLDLRPVFRHRYTQLVIGGEPRELQEALISRTQRLLGAAIELIGHPPSWQRHPEIYAAYRTALSNFTQEGSVMVRTALYLSRFSLRNQARNLGTYATSPGYRFLKGALAGKPAILVAAGPSLNRNIERLRAAQGKITIIAVSTALRPLIARGIRPDFTALIDYHRISKRYFEDIPEAIAPPIVCDMKATSAAIDVYPGAPLFGNDLIFNTLFDGTFGDRGDLARGSTVAHIAFHFLAFLEADPILLVGQDLSYPGGLVHVPGTSIQAQEYPSTNRFYSLEMRELEYYFYYRKRFKRLPGNLGGEVPTDEIFYTYITEFERIFDKHEGAVINCTEGGVRLRGTEVSTLATELDRFADAERPNLEQRIREQVASVDRAAIVTGTRTILDKRRRELRQLKRIYRKLLRLLDATVEINEEGKAADNKVAKVLELHAEAKAFGKIFLVLSSLAQSDGWRRINDDRRLDAESLSGVEKQLRQARRDRRYVRGLHKACGFLEDCFDAADVSLDGIDEANGANSGAAIPSRRHNGT